MKPATKAAPRKPHSPVFLGRWDARWESVLDDRSRPLRDRLLEFYREYTQVIFRPEWIRLYMYFGLAGLTYNKRYIARSQCTLLCGDASELLPDLVLLRAEPHRYRDRHPGPADVLLLIEVADESLGFDRGSKLRAYAAAGIPEYWIVNVRESRVEVHREPAGESFRTVHSAGRGDTLAPLFAESGEVPLADIFP